MGSFLEFLYTGEYFPRKVPGQRVLEHDPSMPGLDDTGDHLLRHARIYTLADSFGMELLKKLASSKIHCINSTAKGELAYARYVYAHTAADDTSVRAPIASFWAARSHALRAEAESEFKNLCLEHPQFGYDVLSKCTHLYPVVPRCGPRLRRGGYISCPELLVLVARGHGYGRPWEPVYIVHANVSSAPSPRPRRQAQARAKRKDAPCHVIGSQAVATQRLALKRRTRRAMIYLDEIIFRGPRWASCTCTMQLHNKLPRTSTMHESRAASLTQQDSATG